MAVQESSYLLILSEIDAQPDLKADLGTNDLAAVAHRFSGSSLEEAIEQLGAQPWQPTGDGLSVVHRLSPPGARALNLSSQTGYEQLCRAALLALFWNDVPTAEHKVNVAKQQNDDWAFAHHVYGLLRGLQGNVGGARFELELALARETFDGARARMQRAFDVLLRPTE
jgi:CubicO group peptidase (beta-lactamase class C family)